MQITVFAESLNSAVEACEDMKQRIDKIPCDPPIHKLKLTPLIKQLGEIAAMHHLKKYYGVSWD